MRIPLGVGVVLGSRSVGDGLEGDGVVGDGVGTSFSADFATQSSHA